MERRTLRDVTMRERYSVNSRLREQRMRIDAGILGIRLMREARTPEDIDEARRYLRPLREWGEVPHANTVLLAPGGRQTDDPRVTLHPVFDILKKEQPQDNELEEASGILVRVLDELRSASRQ